MTNSLLALAVKCLSRKDYSQESLRKKLSIYCDNQSEIESVIRFLNAKGFISDKRFVSNVIDRYSMNYGYGFIIQILKSHGVENNIILEETSILKDSEFDRAYLLIKRKFSKSTKIDNRSFVKYARFLGNRGFAKNVVYKVIKSIFADID